MNGYDAYQVLHETLSDSNRDLAERVYLRASRNGGTPRQMELAGANFEKAQYKDLIGDPKRIERRVRAVEHASGPVSNDLLRRAYHRRTNNVNYATQVHHPEQLEDAAQRLRKRINTKT